jgi:pilus assembly protein Flp/PilA
MNRVVGRSRLYVGKLASWRLYRTDDGATVVEYALLLALVAVVVVVAVSALGTSTNSLLANAVTAFGS